MWGTDYELVTSATQLVAGCNYIIADGTSGSVNVISTESNTNNRRTTTATVSNNKISGANAIMVFTLGGSSNAWTFTTTNYAGTDGFLYNNDTGNNRLFVGNNTEYNKFTISFSNNAISSIKCNANSKKNLMCFNGTLVACYDKVANNYKIPQLYKEVSTSSDPCTVTFSAGEHGTCSTESLTEASAGAGVTLPNVTANGGWHFEGWSKDETPTSANAGAAGATFKPTQNCTVYAYYKLIPATPTFNVDAGTVEKGSTVELSCATDGATIKYTTDGNDPTSSSTTYSSAIALNADQTIKAIAIKDGVSSSVASATYTIATHTAKFSINGTIDETKNSVVAKGEAIIFPSVSEIDGVEFMGWMKNEGIDGTQDNAPTMVSAETMGTDDVIYYAVFAVPEEGGAETLTKITAVSQMTAGTYALIKDEAYYLKSIESTSVQTVTAVTKTNGVINIAADMKWIVTGDNTNGFVFTTPGKDSDGDAMYLWGSATNNGVRIQNDYSSANAQKTWFVESNNTYGIVLYNNSDTKGKRWLCVYVSSGTDQDWRNYSELKASQYPANIYKIGGGISYSDYCTTVSLDPQPTIDLSAATLTEYAGNDNSTITVSVTEPAYTGILEASTDNDVVATASISDGKVVINALTAGTANITITAPAITGFRKSTATIAVTVENKKAANLVFAETTQTVSMDAEPFAAYTISSKATDAEEVTYSLDIKGDATGTPIASLEMIEGVPTITLSGTKATTDTRTIDVVATTEETHMYAAGEARYQLIVTKRNPQIAWSASEVTVDLNEEEKLPTLANPRNLAITYNSTNKDVADFNEGVLELKKAGTTTIQASIGSSGYYDATTVSYELTFAPRYTVTFKVFGQDDVVLREETSGAGVTAPAVSSMGSKVFRGWAEEEIDGTTDIAPTFVTTANLDDNKILYAVFATQTQSSSEGSSTLTAEAIAENIMAKKMAYSDAERSYDDGTITWAVRGYAENDESSYIQIKKDAGTYIKIAAPGAISNVSFDITTASNDNFSGGVYLTTSPTGDPANDSNVKGSVNLSAKKTGTISTISGSNNTLYIQVGSAARLFNIAVTYGTPAVYSAYCTSITSCEITLTYPEGGDYGFSTFCGSANYTVVDAKAYKAKVENGVLVLTKLEGVIPAGNSEFENGVVIAGTPGETATIHYTTDEATADMTGNQLLGTLAVTPAAYLKGDATYLMVFSKGKGGFVSYTGDYVPAYKACLPYNSPVPVGGAPMRMVFGRDNLPTNNVNVNVNDNQGTKVMIDGRLYILRDGKTYDSFGRLVK